MEVVAGNVFRPLAMLLCAPFVLLGQTPSHRLPETLQTPQAPTVSTPTLQSDTQAEAELQTGTDLTRRGQFTEAIRHLLAAQGRVSNEYAANFNLALCYVATGQFKPAIQILTSLRSGAHDNGDVNDLLAQAYVGASENDQAFEALKRAADLSPTNEKMYTFVADACMVKQAYAFGIQVVQLGLQHLPDSARLHYERAMFLSLLDQFDKAKTDFDLARQLSPASDIAFVAAVQEALFEGNVPEAVRAARDGIGKGHTNFMLLTLLGEALLRSGIAPGQPEFEEAGAALEKAVAERPNYPSSQLALGKLYLLENRPADAIAHLQIARDLNPDSPAVYSNLAAAYRKQGNLAQAQASLAELAKINQAQAEKIRLAPGDRKSSSAVSGVADNK